jgi:4-amino-4-deoxychorismate lyase
VESPLCPPTMTPAGAPPSALIPPDPASFRVIETFGWDGKRFPRVHRHMARMGATCARFGIPFDPMQVLVRLDAVPDSGPLRIRATVALDGSVAVTHGPLTPLVGPWRVGVASDRLAWDDPWLRVKTTERGLYDRVRAALPAGIDENLFVNDRGEVCEGTITNLFFDAGLGFCTPPLVSGLLPGILRAELLETGRCREAVLPLAALSDVQLWVGNALRGLIVAELVKGAE